MTQHDVVVVGGGNAGISLAARLVRDGWDDVALVESEDVHRYRPLLSYVGGGEAAMPDLERPATSVVPDGVTAVRDRVVSCDPASSSVTTLDGKRLEARRALVVCTGLEEDWDATPGLAAAYAVGWAGSTFVIESAPRVWPALRDLRRGRVVFSVPPEPAPCAATAMKPMLMACDHWRREGVLASIEVHLVLPGSTPIGVPRADEVLEQVLASYDVRVWRDAVVSGLDGRSVSIRTAAGVEQLDEVDFAHVVPHYRAPHWVVDSGLAGATPAGLVDVDAETLQHRTHPRVWSIGDVADVRTRPSGGALRKQVAVLAHNLRHDEASWQRYDGYTVMPVTTARRRLMLVEVDRDGGLQPTVPFPDLLRPRFVTWWADRYVLPQVYFRRLLRGKV